MSVKLKIYKIEAKTATYLHLYINFFGWVPIRFDYHSFDEMWNNNHSEWKRKRNTKIHCRFGSVRLIKSCYCLHCQGLCCVRFLFVLSAAQIEICNIAQKCITELLIIIARNEQIVKGNYFCFCFVWNVHSWHLKIETYPSINIDTNY